MLNQDIVTVSQALEPAAEALEVDPLWRGGATCIPYRIPPSSCRI